MLGADRRSLARRYGFRPGDIIVRVNDAAIADVAALKAALDAGDRAGWRIEVKRGAEVLTLEVSR